MGSLRNIVKRSEEREESEAVRQNLPEIITPSQVIRREVGGTAILACSVENLGQYVVMWKQDGRVISGQIRLPTSPPDITSNPHQSSTIRHHKPTVNQRRRQRHVVRAIVLGWLD